MSNIKIQSEYDDLDKYENEDGDIIYFKKDSNIIHNSYGPAIIWKNGYKEYFIYGKRHRLDGPAVIYPNGEECYYINNQSLSKKKFELHPERLKYLGKEYLTCLG